MKLSVVMYVVAMMALAASATLIPQLAWSQTATSSGTPGGDMQLCGATFQNPVIEPAPPGTPPNVAAFLGQWGDGHQGWRPGISPLICGAMFVVSVTPDGSAKVILIAGKNALHGPLVHFITAKIDGDYLPTPSTRFHRVGDELDGLGSYGEYVLPIDLPRITQK